MQSMQLNSTSAGNRGYSYGIDDRNERVGYKIREGEVEKVALYFSIRRPGG